jgi:O-antigen/teichoic acid export membrane protein
MIGRTQLNALAASVQMAITTASGLLYFGFLIRTLGPEALGSWLAWLSLGMIACLADLGLREALVRGMAVAVASEDRRQAIALLDTTLITVAASMALALALLMGVLPHFFDFGTAARRASTGLIVSVAGMVWLQRVADVHAAALEGLQRYALVARNNLVGVVAGLLTMVLLVPRAGVYAASLGLIVQYALSGVAHVLALRAWQPTRRAIPRRWNAVLCRQGLGYGMSLQGAVGTFLLIESGVKLALSRADALALLSFFDLAFRVGRGLRNLLAAGNRVLVPALAAVHLRARSTESLHDAALREAAERELQSVYLRSFQVMLFAALPTFALCGAASGLVSLLARGAVDPLLVSAFLSTLPAWYALTLADPAMNNQMAAGRLAPMLKAHGAMCLLLLLGGVPLWTMATAPAGFPVGMATIAVATASVMLPCGWMIWAHHRSSGLPLRTLSPVRLLVATCVAMVAALMPGLFAPTFAGQLAGMTAAVLLTLAGLRMLPMWHSVLAALRRLRRRPGTTT